MTDPKDTKDIQGTELSDEQLESASGGAPTSKYAGDGDDGKVKKSAD